MPKAKVDPARRNSKEKTPRATKRSAAKPVKPGLSGSQARRGAAARVHAEAMRQAECAAMLIAVTRLLLNMRGRDYAAWLRSVADDFEATDPDEEHPEDVSNDLISLAERDRTGNEAGGPREHGPELDLDIDTIDPRRPH
jgi:hypothetical protein